MRRLEQGRVLLGGSPFRLLRLSPAGVRLLDRIEAGEPVAVGARAAGAIDSLLDAGILHPRPIIAPLSSDAVTVVIPVRDRPGRLADTLRVLDPALRVIVVDDGSVDPDVHRQVAEASGAAVVRLGSARGPAGARNRGLEAVTTDLVAFVDAGCTPEPGCLETLTAFMDDPRVALAAPRIGGRARQHATALVRYEGVHSSLDLGPSEGPVRAGGPIPYVPSTCLLVRTEVARALGGFDEALIVGEDVDFVWRLGAAGHRARYVPEARAGHDDPRRLWSWLRRRVDYGTSAAPLDARHPSSLRPLGVSTWSLGFWTLLATGKPKSALGLLAVTTGLMTRTLRVAHHGGRESLRLVARGQLVAGRSMAAAVTREWWPLAMAAALVSRRARRLLLVALVVPALDEWWRLGRPLDPLRWLALRTLDNTGYGAGVWVGVLRDGRHGPLRPRLVSARVTPRSGPSDAAGTVGS